MSESLSGLTVTSRYTPVQFKNAIPFLTLSPKQTAQLGHNEGFRYNCPAAHTRRSSAMFPVMVAAALYFHTPSRYSPETVQRRVLEHAGFGVEAVSLPASKLLHVAWKESFFQAVADLYVVDVIVYVEKQSDYRTSTIAFFYSVQAVPHDQMSMVFVQTQSDFIMLYRSSFDEELNQPIDASELASFNIDADENAIAPVAKVTGQIVGRIDFSKRYDSTAAVVVALHDVFSIGQEYDVGGEIVHNAPQAIAAGLVLVSTSPYYGQRIRHTFMAVRAAIGSKRFGSPEIWDTKTNQFRRFSALDFAAASEIYGAEIAVRHIVPTAGTATGTALYAVFRPQSIKSRFAIYLNYKHGYFTLFTPEIVDQPVLEVYNSVVSEQDQDASIRMYPRVVPIISYTQHAPLSPTSSSSPPAGGEDTLHDDFGDDDRAIPDVSSKVYSNGIATYKHAADINFNIPLLDNFPKVSPTTRAFNDNVPFLWKIDFTDGKRWPHALQSGSATATFLSNPIPGDHRTIELRAGPIVANEIPFFSNNYSQLLIGQTAHAVVKALKPTGSLPGDLRSVEFENALVDIDGFMRIFDLLGGLVERCGLAHHRYNLYRIYSLMLEAIASDTLDTKVVTEQILWFLYTFLLVDNPHFDASNPRITTGMANMPIDIFAEKVFGALFASPCFKWEYKLSHLWLFAYVTLHPDACVLPTLFLRSKLLEFIASKTFGNPSNANTSTKLAVDEHRAQFLAIHNNAKIRTDITDDALGMLLSWRLPVGKRPQLPIYTIDYELLFKPEASSTHNVPELTVESLFYHNQIHIIIHAVGKAPSTFPGASSPPLSGGEDNENVDAFLYSLQTFDGIPLTQYAIKGHGHRDPADQARYLHGADLDAPDTNHVPIIKPDLPPVLTEALLVDRIDRVFRYFNADELPSNPNAFFTTTMTAFFVSNPDGTLRMDNEPSPYVHARATKQWKNDYSRWYDLYTRYAKLESMLGEIERLSSSASSSSSPSGALSSPPLRGGEDKTSLAGLKKYLTALAAWDCGYQIPANRPPRQFVANLEMYPNARAELELLVIPPSPMPPIYPITLPKYPVKNYPYVQPPFQRILRSSVGLCLVGVEFAKRSQVDSFSNFVSNLRALTLGLDRTAVLLLAAMSPIWAFPLCKDASRRITRNATTLIRVRRDERFLTDPEIQVVLHCTFLPDVLSEAIMSPLNPTETLALVAGLHEKVMVESVPIQSPLRAGVPVELVDAKVSLENRILRVATNATLIQEFALSNDFFKFYTTRYAYLSGGVSVYNADAQPEGVFDFAKAIIRGNLDGDTLSLKCACIKVRRSFGPPLNVKRPVKNVSTSRLVDARSPDAARAGAEYYIEYEIESAFAALGTTANRTIFFLHSPLTLKYLGMRELLYNPVTNNVAYMLTFAVSISNDVLESMAPGFDNLSVVGHIYRPKDSEPKTLLNPKNNPMTLVKTTARSTTVVRMFHFNSLTLTYLVWQGVLQNRPYIPGILCYHDNARYTTIDHLRRNKDMHGFEQMFKLHGGSWQPGQAATSLDTEASTCFNETFMAMESVLGWPHTLSHDKTAQGMLAKIPLAYVSVPLRDLISTDNVSYRKRDSRPHDRSHPAWRKDGGTKIARIGDDLELEASEIVQVYPYAASTKAKSMTPAAREVYLATILEQDPRFLNSLLDYIYGGIKDTSDARMRVTRLEKYRAAFPEALFAMEDAYASSRLPMANDEDLAVTDLGAIYAHGAIAVKSGPEVLENTMWKRMGDGFSRVKHVIREKSGGDDVASDDVWLANYGDDARYAAQTAAGGDRNSKRFKDVMTALLLKEVNDHGFLYKKIGVVCILLSENLYILLTRVFAKVTPDPIAKQINKAVFGPWLKNNYSIVFLPMFQILERTKLTFLVDESSKRVMAAMNTQLLIDVCKMRCGFPITSTKFNSRGSFVFPKYAWSSDSSETTVVQIARTLKHIFSVPNSLITPSLLLPTLREFIAKGDRKRLINVRLPLFDNFADDVVPYVHTQTDQNTDMNSFSFYGPRPLVTPPSKKAARVALQQKVMQKYERYHTLLEQRSANLLSRLRIAAKDSSYAFFDANLLYQLAVQGNANNGMTAMYHIVSARFELEEFLVDHLLLPNTSADTLEGALIQHTQLYKKTLKQLAGLNLDKAAAAQKIVWRATRSRAIAIFFDRFSSEIPPALVELSKSPHKAVRVDAYREALAMLQQKEFGELPKVFSADREVAAELTLTFNNSQSTFGTGTGPRASANDSANDSAEVSDDTAIPAESVDGDDRKRKVDEWLTFFEDYADRINYTSRYEVETPQDAINGPRFSPKNQELLINYAIAKYLVDSSRAVDTLTTSVNLGEGHNNKILTAIFTNDAVALRRLRVFIHTFLANKIHVGDVPSDFTVKMEDLDPTGVQSYGVDKWSITTETITRAFLRTIITLSRTRMAEQLDAIASLTNLGEARFFAEQSSPPTIESVYSNISLKKDTHLNAILNAIISNLPSDPRVYLQQLTRWVLLLKWPTEIALKVLRERGVTASSDIVAANTAKADAEYQAFVQYASAAKQTARRLITPPDLYTYLEPSLAIICWANGALFSTLEEVTSLSLFIKNRQHSDTVLTKHGITQDMVDVASVVKQLVTLALDRSSKLSAMLKGYAFTPFERKAALLVWKRVTLVNQSSVLAAFKRHDWLSVLSQSDITTVFQQLAPKDPEFVYGLSYLRSITNARDSIITTIRDTFGRTLLPAQLALMHAAFMFALPQEYVQRCAVLEMWMVLHTAVVARITTVTGSIGVVHNADDNYYYYANLGPKDLHTLSMDLNRVPDVEEPAAIVNDLPESNEPTVMTTAILRTFLNANIKYQEQVTTSSTSSMRGGGGGTLKAIYEAGITEFTDNERFQALGLQIADVALIPNIFSNPDSLYITLAYLVRGMGAVDDYDTVIKQPIIEWLTHNLSRPVSETIPLTFREIIHVPLSAGQLLDDDAIVSYLRSPLVVVPSSSSMTTRSGLAREPTTAPKWNDLVMLLAAAHLFERPIRVVTTLAEDAHWQATFVASAHHLTNERLDIFCVNMLFYFPLSPEGTTFR